MGTPVHEAGRVKVPVYKKARRVAWALVDEGDYESVMGWLWRRTAQGYVQCNRRPDAILMHRFLLGLGTGDPLQVDHVNGDRLDNRRVNLRVATTSQNLQNRHHASRGSSAYRGVSFCKQTGRWIASAKLNYKQVWLGRHDTEEEAAAVAAAFRAKHMPFSREFDEREKENDVRSAA